MRKETFKRHGRMLDVINESRIKWEEQETIHKLSKSPIADTKVLCTVFDQNKIIRMYVCMYKYSESRSSKWSDFAN